MNITETKQGNVTVIKPQGRLDSISAPEFESRMGALIDGGNRLIAVDCTELPYVSSAGLRAFLSIAKKLKQIHGKLVLGALTSQVKEIFDLAGFSSILPISSTVDDAVSSCSREG